MTLTELKALYIKAQKAYYNDDEPIMSDAKFDALENKIQRLDPNWSRLKKTGTKVNKKTEVKLPFFMPSLGKAYPEALPRWIKAHQHDDYALMDKLDGSSLLLTYDKGHPKSLITRGNGELGGDISFLIPSFRLPSIAFKQKVSFRCEAVIPKDRFAKWSKEFDNSRNMVNGLLNRKVAHAANKDIDIVVLGVFGRPLLEGLLFAKQQGFHTVSFSALTFAGINKPKLVSDTLAHRKKNSPYEIDGLVIAPTKFHYEYESAEKVRSIIAYKENLDTSAAKVTVKKIIWQVSHNSRLIPKIQIEPTQMDGVVVTYVTCHNAQWMKERRIGPGAILKVLRSGGVIPKIVDVVKPGRLQLPKQPHRLEGVHFVLDGKVSGEDKTVVQVKRMVRFFNYLGIEGIKGKTIEALYAQGFNTPFHYMKYRSDKNKFVKLGLGPKQASNVVAELEEKLSNVDLLKLMVASTCFDAGVGERRLKAIQPHVPMGMLLASYKLPMVRNKVLEIPGFSDKTADLVLAGIPAFLKFLATAQKLISVVEVKPTKKLSKKGPLTGTAVSFTGYRSKEEEDRILALGGEVVPFGSRTKVLLVKAGGKASTKADKAAEKGIRVTTFDKLIK